MIWDCVLFHDEVEMLECRLTEIDSVVDRFVIVEGDMTFRGKPKASVYLENEARFAPWKDKIVHVVAPLSSRLVVDPWDMERFSREYMSVGIAGAGDDDIVLVSDVDEIPKTEALQIVLRSESTDPFTLDMRMLTFAVDWELLPRGWLGTAAQRGPRRIESFQGLRDSRMGHMRLHDAGWHFSWVGGNARQVSKLASFAHAELADLEPSLEGFYANGHHIHGEKARAVEVDDTYPRYVRERRCPASWFRPRSV